MNSSLKNGRPNIPGYFTELYGVNKNGVQYLGQQSSDGPGSYKLKQEIKDAVCQLGGNLNKFSPYREHRQ